MQTSGRPVARKPFGPQPDLPQQGRPDGGQENREETRPILACAVRRCDQTRDDNAAGEDHAFALRERRSRQEERCGGQLPLPLLLQPEGDEQRRRRDEESERQVPVHVHGATADVGHDENHRHERQQQKRRHARREEAEEGRDEADPEEPVLQMQRHDIRGSDRVQPVASNAGRPGG